MALTAGTRLGPYSITAPLAAGGMGEVYRARDTKLDRDVAIKVLPDLVSHDPERLARFEREAKTLASLNHPNIAIVYGFEETQGTTALVMELVDGVTLAARIAGPTDPAAGDATAGRPIPLDECLPIARQIAEALEAAHEHGVVHRDLKPANVMVREDGTVKVLDFGLAKPALSEAGAGTDLALSQAPTLAVPTMTQAGMILGTAAYMSPEQAKGRDADKRSDIWAFGCVLYEMLTGARAFPGADLAETLAAVIKSEPDWTALPPDTPASVHRLLRRCLIKDRKARLADASSLRIEIDDARSRPEQGPVASRTFRRERLMWATGVLLLGLVSAFALASVARQAPRESEIRFDIAMPSDLDILSLAISPDGRQIGFAARRDNRSSVWVYTLDGRPARTIEGTEGAQDRVFWSPDGTSLGFFADGKLKRVDIESGAVQTLADAPVAIGGGGAWSRDGTILFAPTRGPLFRVSQGGGAPAVVTRVEGPRVRHVSPQFLPDGRHFLYFSAGDPAVGGVYVADLQGTAAPVRVLADADAAAIYVGSGHLVYPRGGSLIAQPFDLSRLRTTGDPWQVTESIEVDQTQGLAILSASDSGLLVYRGQGAAVRERRLVWLDRSGKELQRLDDRDPVNARHLALSPDGRLLAVYRDSIWIFDTARGGLTRLTFEQDSTPLWSPEGDRVIFQSTRDGVRNIYQRAVGAAEDELLLETPGSKSPHDWSPDGRLLLYRDVDPRTGFDLWVLPVERDPATDSSGRPPDESQGGRGRLQPAAGEKPMPVAQTSASERNGQFSPDGRWIAYESDESGRFEIYVQPFGRQGARQRVSLDGGTQARWRGDGTELFYIAPGGRLMAVPLTAGSGGQPGDFGTPVMLFPVRVEPGDPVYHQYIVSRDGQRFLVNMVTEATPEVISAIVNWSPPR
jgi:serine/threonine protein kinase/Tol biopolymer transport system component